MRDGFHFYLISIIEYRGKQFWLFTSSSMCFTEMMKKKKYSLQHFCLYTGVAHMMCVLYLKEKEKS